MRPRLRRRAAIAALVVAAATAGWVAHLPQAPVPREILVGGGTICLGLFSIIGALAIIEARSLSRAEERMRRFLADASHELRTPIAAVQASAETLIRTDPPRAGREDLVLAILRETHRAGRLVDDLLTMTRLEQRSGLAMEPFDLVPLAAAVVGQARELAPAVTVQLHAPEHCQLLGDPRRIAQILDNLLTNARLATAGGGRITVEVTCQPAHVDVEVADSGAGIPKADRERIFERFTRLAGSYPGAPGGNGLGLAIARGIASAHHGTLSCADPAGSGARFLLRLPRPRQTGGRDRQQEPAAGDR
jgi:two-component system, OmpR family, sensor kinase